MAEALTAVDPRIERSRCAVLEATIALLAESGYGAVTIEAVAARSGVAKSTIYRHWPGRVELIHDAFLELKPPVVLPSEGDVREQVIAVLENFARNAGESLWARCLPSLIDAAAHDAEAARLHNQLSCRGRQSLVDLLAAGVANGDLPPDLDPELMTEALAGPILLRLLLALPPLDPSQVRDLVDQLIPPRQPDGRPTGGKRTRR